MALTVVILQRYLEKANAKVQSDIPIFRPLRLFRSENKFKQHGIKLSYTRWKEIFKSTLKELGYGETKNGLHSLRAGGATEAVNQGDISERLLKLHGRWKNDTAKDMYIHENVEKRLCVNWDCKQQLVMYQHVLMF